MPNHDIVDKFTTHLKNVLTRALVLAVEVPSPEVLPKHLLWAIATEQGAIAAEVLRKQDLEVDAIHDFALCTTSEPLMEFSGTPTLSADAKRMIERAVFIAHTYQHRYVGTEHLLSAVLQVGDTELTHLFQEEKISTKAMQEQLTLVFKSTSRFPEMEELLLDVQKPTPSASGRTLTDTTTEEEPEVEEEEKSKTPALDFFTRDLTSRIVANTLDPVIGRDTEIERTMEILCRRTKNNPLLLGEPGVGKTAIVEGLAKRIVEGTAPPALADKRILSLDLTAVIAGTMYRGEFEGRLKQLIEETRAQKNVILFIDELHTIMGAGSAGGTLDAANILKPSLARGDIHCIGATTPGEFKKHIETDSALERRFQPVRVEEPNEIDTIHILQGLAPSYTAFHNLHIEPEAIEAAVHLSKRYLHDRQLPDKAIDLLDEALASKRLRQMPVNTHVHERRLLEETLADVKARKRTAITEEVFEDAIRLKAEEVELRKRLHAFVVTKPDTTPLGSITAEDIAEVVSRSAGVPAMELLTEERGRLANLEHILAQRIVGQAPITRAVAETVRRARLGLASHERPRASFLFVGPSGVGKTELARTLATELFHDKTALIHLNMSEFSEPYSLSKLVGSPAGYVGYREHAKLTDPIRQRPYAVVLLDEFEKAHRDVQALLLQLLETGEVCDATGRKVSFRQTIVIMTSNAGSDRYVGASLGFGDGDDELTAIETAVRQDLHEHFRPELLNRIDRILPFRPLEHDALTSIAVQGLEEMRERLASRGIEMKIGEDVADFIAKTSHEPKVGARAIRRYLQDHVETLIATKMLAKRSSKLLHLKRSGKHLTLTQK